MRMKRIYYLFAISAILAPGLVFAVTAPNLQQPKVISTTAPNGYSVQLNWTNNGSYSSLQLTRHDPSGNIGIPPTNIANTATSYTDTNQNQQWLPANTSAGGGPYTYTVQASQGANSASVSGNVLMPFVDSQIVTVTTKAATSTPPVSGSNTYSLVCAPQANSIYVGWTANTSSPAVGTVYASAYATFTPRQSTAIATANGSGNYVMNTPAGSTEYFTITDSQYNALSNTVGPCTTLTAVSNDAPSQLRVFTNGPTTLYLNWKDNSTSTATSTFEVQRFQVTPATPSNPRLISAPSAFMLSWTNTPVNTAPFYTLIERSTNANFTTNLVSSTVSSTATSYADATAQAGTTYYYRISNISQIPVQSFYQSPAGSTVVKPAAPASGYATANATYGPPAGPVGFLEQSLQSAMAWLFKTPDAEAQTPQTINYENYFKTIMTTTTPALADTGLAPGTVYMYRVLLVYPNGQTSTPSNMVAGVTLPSGSQTATGAVHICTAYGHCNYNVAGYHSPDFTQTSETQCTFNADCRSVGRASQQTQEQ